MGQTLNEGRAHDFERVPRADHRHRPTLQVAAEPPELDQAILLLLHASELVDHGVPAEKIERVAEPGGAGGVDREDVDLVWVWS